MVIEPEPVMATLVVTMLLTTDPKKDMALVRVAEGELRTVTVARQELDTPVGVLTNMIDSEIQRRA